MIDYKTRINFGYKFLCVTLGFEIDYEKREAHPNMLLRVLTSITELRASSGHICTILSWSKQRMVQFFYLLLHMLSHCYQHTDNVYVCDTVF